ncbi:ZinT family metal-binding protein [Salsuginibacillus kocurii]|uniref:ZinT family metal-binding protein n=1 Tax=Salsuginibacillus kocurii TaxID=427078 RepID=UPI00039A6252|nr:ZinT/AdcA family metal-binding protein [Salsuginibacillus kocurii]
MSHVLAKWGSIIALSVGVTACQTSDSEVEPEESQEKTVESTEIEGEQGEELISELDVPEKVAVQRLATEETINIEAIHTEETDYDKWRWYIRDDEEGEWEPVPDQEDRTFTGEATDDGKELKVVLFDDDDEAYAQSGVLDIVIEDHNHAHSHAHDEESQRIYDGYFEDHEVEDRELSDWEGDWQSVYPYLKEGSLDPVFEHKAEEEGDMTEEEYKEYYNEGYETEVDRIVIEDNTVTFFENGVEYTGDYEYDGYEILTYEAGNRGVRYVFALTGKDDDMPDYIQFSDHNIFSTDSHHFHLYWGDDREELLDEVTNWPTYYPSNMDRDEIVHEMIVH